MAAAVRQRLGGGYEWRADNDPTFFPGRHASIYFKDQRVSADSQRGLGGGWVGSCPTD